MHEIIHSCALGQCDDDDDEEEAGNDVQSQLAVAGRKHSSLLPLPDFKNVA